MRERFERAFPPEVRRVVVGLLCVSEGLYADIKTNDVDGLRTRAGRSGSGGWRVRLRAVADAASTVPECGPQPDCQRAARAALCGHDSSPLAGMRGLAIHAAARRRPQDGLIAIGTALCMDVAAVGHARPLRVSPATPKLTCPVPAVEDARAEPAMTVPRLAELVDKIAQAVFDGVSAEELVRKQDALSRIAATLGTQLEWRPDADAEGTGRR